MSWSGSTGSRSRAGYRVAPRRSARRFASRRARRARVRESAGECWTATLAPSTIARELRSQLDHPTNEGANDGNEAEPEALDQDDERESESDDDESEAEGAQRRRRAQGAPEGDLRRVVAQSGRGEREPPGPPR